MADISEKRPAAIILNFPPVGRRLEKNAETVSIPPPEQTAETDVAGRSFDSEKNIPTYFMGEAVRLVYSWHESEPGFGVRITRQAKRDKYGNSTFTRAYIARYRGEDGKDIKKTLGVVGDMSYDDAMRRAKALRTDARRQRYGLTPLTDTVETALENYVSINERLSKSTIHTYMRRWALIPEHWRARHMEAISGQMWEDLYKTVRGKHGAETARGLARVAHAIYERLVAIKAVRDNPLTGLAHSTRLYSRLDPRGRVISADLLPAVWEWLHTRAHIGVRDYALVALLTGMRRGLLEDLRWDHLDAKTWTYKVPAEVRGNKAKKLIPMPLPSYLVEAVFKPRLKAKRPGDIWIIPSHKRVEKPLRSIRGSLETMKTLTGCEVSPHDFRRTYGRIAYAEFGDMTVVRRLMTHNLQASEARMATTAGYVVSSQTDYKAMVERVAARIIKDASVSKPAEDKVDETDAADADDGSNGSTSGVVEK